MAKDKKEQEIIFVPQPYEFVLEDKTESLFIKHKLENVLEVLPKQEKELKISLLFKDLSNNFQEILEVNPSTNFTKGDFVKLIDGATIRPVKIEQKHYLIISESDILITRKDSPSYNKWIEKAKYKNLVNENSNLGE